MLNKGISTPIAIGIILILAIAVGSFTYLQYGEMWRETEDISEAKLLEKEDCKECEENFVSWCQECKSLGWPKGNQDSPLLSSNLTECLIECFDKDLPYTNCCDDKKNLCEEFGVKVEENITDNNDNYSVMEVEVTDCGKAKKSLYKDGIIVITSGMIDEVSDDALKCFSESLLSQECIGTSIEIEHCFTNSSTGEQEISKYKYTIFSKEDRCYIKGEYLDSTVPQFEYNKNDILACPKDLSKTSEDYEKHNVSLEDVPVTFTAHFLSDLHTYHQGVKTGFIENKECFIVY